MKTIIVSTILIFVIILSFGFYKNSQKEEQALVGSTEALQIMERDHVVGDRNAGVVMFEYSDLECPACGAYYPLVKEIKGEYGDRMAFVMRHFPLSFHRQALPAAYSLEAASNQGKFLEMLDMIFTTQKDWSGKSSAEQVFERYAQELGLDMDMFRSDRDSEATKLIVEADISTGLALKVSATPTFILQGKKIQPKSLEEFRSLIEMEL